MQRRIFAPLAIVMTMLMAMLSVASVSAYHDGQTDHDFADPAFERTWQRTDKPVADDEVDRTFIWGPAPYTPGMMEEYADSPGNERLVQYFDKSRMEINNPDAFDDGLWYVTNGLLVMEMITGDMQVGDAEFEDREPAGINIVGDPGDESGASPTYADINRYGLMMEPALSDGETITQRVDSDGNISNDDSLAEYGVTAAYRVQVPKIDHQVASVFWDFITSEGLVMEDGQLVTEQLFQSEFYATGLPITEAYWTTAMVGGEDRDILWQCFERRCLTFTPGNPDGFVVEAGNVGQHYYEWRYGDDDGNGGVTEEFMMDFGTLNNSGVTGTIHITIDGDQLHVMVDAMGLEPGMHPMHIHGFEDQSDATCPTATEDVNLDGIISLEEGVPAYGGVLFALGEVEADDSGMASFDQTFTLTDEEMTALGSLEDNVVVMHGLTTSFDQDGDGTVDEYEPLLPVACADLSDDDDGNGGNVENYTAWLGALNDSGVMGMAHLTLDGDQLTVMVEATGLEANMAHAQHIHGKDTNVTDNGIAVCPTGFADDEDSNGILTLTEGLDKYGDVLLALDPTPTANGQGEITFNETFTVDGTFASRLDERAIVLHGLTVNGEYDGLLPVACGVVARDLTDNTGEFDERSFTAVLSGDEEVPQTESNATGNFVARFSTGMQHLSFQLNVTNDSDDESDIQGITAAHIHLGERNENGPVIATLVMFDNPEQEDGVLVSGFVTDADLTGPLAGETINDLFDLMRQEGVYINVHSVQNPDGEIRGQIMADLDDDDDFGQSIP